MSKIEIEVHEAYGPGLNALAKYRVSGGMIASLWTNDLDHAVTYLKYSLQGIERSQQAWPPDGGRGD